MINNKKVCLPPSPGLLDGEVRQHGERIAVLLAANDGLDEAVIASRGDSRPRIKTHLVATVLRVECKSE